MANEDFYGEGAITGSLDDAHSVSITTPGSPTSFSVNPTEGANGGQQVPPQEDKPQEEATPQQQEKEPLTPEQQATQEAQAQIAAKAEVEKTLGEKGIDFGQLQTEFETNGSLSAATYEALEKAGYSKTVVNTYIAGVEAASERFTNAVYQAAGGAEEFKQMTSFISSLGKAHVDTFNSIIDKGDIMQIQVALQGYKAQMIAKQGTKNSVYLGGAGGQPVGGFPTVTEMINAINDPRYARDAKYTHEVRAKIVKTKF